MSAVDNQIIHVCRTVYGAYLQTCLKLGLPFTMIPNTTLNERLGIQPSIAPSVGEDPTMKYLVFGNRGHATTVASDGSDEIIPVPHDAEDAGLYGLIPIVLRDTDDDLPVDIRKDFGLRRIEPHNGVNKIAYYALRLDYSTVTASLQSIRVVEGEVVVEPYTPTADNLNPVPPQITNSGVVLGSDTSISASAIITVRLSENVVAEMVNAHRVRTGSNRSPVISELGFCSGVDRNVQATNGGAGSFLFNEVIACQLNVIISTHHAIGYSSTGATLAFDVGNTEPLLGTNSLNGTTWLS
jgi:hypothetical protein